MRGEAPQFIDNPNPNGTDVIPREKLIPPELFKLIEKSIPMPCVDLVILKGLADNPQVLLIKRSIEPNKGMSCIPGGRVLIGETLEDSIDRHAFRELGVKVKIISPFDSNHPVRVFDNPIADPQKHPIINLYPVEITGGTINKKGPEFEEADWFDFDKLPEEMGFTHKEEILCVLSALNII